MTPRTGIEACCHIGQVTFEALVGGCNSTNSDTSWFDGSAVTYGFNDDMKTSMGHR